MRYMFFTVMGIADQIVFYLFGAIFIERYVIFTTPSVEHLKTIAEKYSSFMTLAYYYRLGELAEALLTVFIVFRLILLLTINRQLFILCRTIGKAVRSSIYFFWVFVPVLLGFTMMAHQIWGSYHEIFSSFIQSLMSLIMLILGDLDIASLQDPARQWTSIFFLLFILICILLVINGWVAEFVHIYQNTRIECGYDPADYNWKEHMYVEWTFPGWGARRPIDNLYYTYLRKNARPPSMKDEDDEG